MRHHSIADAIARYIQRHPAAADTDVGIAEWWLVDHETPVAVDEVREALTLLERQGVMEMVTLQDGRILRRAARRQRGA